MADPPASASKPPAPSPAQSSPKFIRHKSAAHVGAPINVSFGCEHIENFHKTGQNTWKTFEQYYIRALHTIRNENPIVSQTLRNGKSLSPSLRPTWLCMQCPFIFSEDARQAHWASPKQHSFFVESRSGCLYCLNCDDYVFDPHFERLRLSNGSKNLKRKYDEFLSPEDYRTVVPNSSLLPCRAIGLRGLYNMGNTCFMSVVLQCLLHNPFIRGYYLSSGHNREDCELPYCVSCALDETYGEFYSLEKTEGFGAVTMLMNSWKTAEASNSDLAGYHQQDAHEYMQFILNHLHTANGGTPNDCQCIIHSTFHGRLQSIVTCDKCNNRTVAVDPFLDLSLDLRAQAKKKQTVDGKVAEEPAVMRLEECLRRFTSDEKLPAADYSCRKCNAQRDATKQFSILGLPPVLCIHLKRFSHAKDKSSKLSTPIKFPLVLDMLPYTTLYVSPEYFTRSKPPNGTARAAANGTSSPTPAAESSQPVNGSKSGDPTYTSIGGAERGLAPSYDALLAEPREYWPADIAAYDLSAVIVHKGEINSGHYVNYAREGGDWFLFDDSKVVRVDEGEVLAAEAYLLIYVLGDVTPWVAANEGA